MLTKNQNSIIEEFSKVGINMYIPKYTYSFSNPVQGASIQAVIMDKPSQVSFQKPIVYLPYMLALKMDESTETELLRLKLILESYIRYMDYRLSHVETIEESKQYQFFYEFFNVVSRLNFIGEYAFIIGKVVPSEINLSSDCIEFPSRYKVEDTLIAIDDLQLASYIFNKKLFINQNNCINVEIPEFETALRFNIPIKSHTLPPNEFLDDFTSIKKPEFIPLIVESYDVFKDALKNSDELNLNVLKNIKVMEKIYNCIESTLPNISEASFERTNEIFKSGLFPVKFDDIKCAIHSFTTNTVKTTKVSSTILKRIFKI